MLKRGFDIFAASAGILLLAPVLLLIGIAVKLGSDGPALFKQERIGRGFRPFFIYKFRTMVADAPRLGPEITAGDDPRITRVGRFLRKTKLDELPQLFNVIKGDMSLVGPRPEVPRYVEAFRADYEEVLAVRPGLTDLASIKFIDEAGVLAQAHDAEAAYRHQILPEKIALAKQYVRESSLLLDMLVLGRTFAKLFTHPRATEKRHSLV